MMSKTDSTTDADWRLLSPCAATAFTRSFFVTVQSHLLGGSLWRAPRDERLVALALQLLQRADGRGAISEATYPHAIQRVALGGRRRGARIRRAGRRFTRRGRASHLHLEPVDGEIFRQRHGIAQRQAWLDHRAGARCL